MSFALSLPRAEAHFNVWNFCLYKFSRQYVDQFKKRMKKKKKNITKHATKTKQKNKKKKRV